MALSNTFNIEDTVSSFHKRLGEIIEDVIGEDRVRRLFDDAGKHPEEYEGKPTGLIALDLGVISSETKTALLVGQAAARTLKLADRTEMLGRSEAYDSQEMQTLESDIVPHDDPVFKFVGSPRDPAEVQKAQATWKIAQMNYNHEIQRLQASGKPDGNEMVYQASAPTQLAVHGLRNAAAGLFETASEMLRAEGHSDAADKLKAVSESVPAHKSSATPKAIANRLMLSDIASVSDDYAQDLRKMADLSTPPARPAAPEGPAYKH